MERLADRKKLDRHALVMAIWLPSGLMAASMFSFAFGHGSPWFGLAGFGVIVAAFVGHVIVNAEYRSGFTVRELALALALYGAGVVAFGVATLSSSSFAEQHFLPMSIGFLAVFVSMLFYLITHYGVRRTFQSFDVVSDFGTERPSPSDSDKGDER